MNEVLKTIADRYSCRDYTGEPLTKEQIDMLVKAALAAPSALNRQPLHVVMCTDKALIEDMDTTTMAALAAEEDKSLYNRFMDRGGKIFYNAPCIMFLASDGSEWAVMDAGIMIENVALAAHALGLGNVICGMARTPLEGPKGKAFLKQLNFPEDREFVIAILLGAAKSGKEPHEVDMSKVTYVD